MSKTVLVLIHFSTGIVTILISIALVMKSQHTKGEHVHGIKDMPFIWTTDLNNWFREDDSRRNTLLIISQGNLDILTIITFYRFSRYS